MKMSEEDYNVVLDAFVKNKEAVREYYKFIKDGGGYKDLDTRVSWDCSRKYINNNFSLGQYKKGLNDTHLTTAYNKALKTVLID